MRETTDVIIIGGGPAGAAAGIAALGSGLRVSLFEAAGTPREKPGETLHPGIAPILDRLGILAGAEAAAGWRPDGQWTAWNAPPELSRYGVDECGAWRAFQLNRAMLDTLLLERFVALGGDLVRPAPALVPMVTAGRVAGVVADRRVVRAPLTIDASGKRGLLRRALGLTVRAISRPLIAHYGYRRGFFDAHPMLVGDGDGWTWIAQVEPGKIAWVSLLLQGGKEPRRLPDALAAMPECGRPGATDVTWRMADRLAGPGWFLAGEAACTLDPAASQGVLRALMSGMMAAHHAAQVRTGATHAVEAERSYSAWLQSWFQHDAARLLTLYRTHAKNFPATLFYA